MVILELIFTDSAWCPQLFMHQREGGSWRWRCKGLNKRRVAFFRKFLWIQWHPWAGISCDENPVALCCEAWTQRAEDPGPAFKGVFGAQDMLRVIGFSILSLPATNNTISAQQQPLMPIHQLKLGSVGLRHSRSGTARNSSGVIENAEETACQDWIQARLVHNRREPKKLACNRSIVITVVYAWIVKNI